VSIVRQHRLEQSVAVSSRDSEFKIRSPAEEASEFLIKARHDRRQVFILLKWLLRLAEAVAFGENGFGRLTVTGRNNFTEELGAKRNCAVPSATCRHKEESQFSYEPPRK
jgi:hypothetical protein